MANRNAAKYSRRIANVGPATVELERNAAGVLVEELKRATEEELYQVSQNPKLTGRMYGSIRQMRGARKYEVAVGYDLRKARYARRRVRMKGISKTWGHRLDMNPGAYLQKHATPQIKRLNRAAQKKIIDV